MVITSLKDATRKIASAEKEVISNLSEYVSDMEERMPLNRSDAVIYENTCIELQEMQLKHARGLMFRSKARWIGEGEQNTKYFFNLEKSRYNAKTCCKLITKNMKEITDDTGIMAEQVSFYADLYKREDDLDDFSHY